jgi:palmitoyltransferase ZDHHC5/8
MYIELIGVNRFYLFVVIIAVHSLLFIYVVLNFTIATFMDPGRFPKQDVFNSLNDEQIKLQTNSNYKNVLINDINVRMKWCATCQFYRPPRSSHCGVCNACIDTMDHHCNFKLIYYFI